uniref:Dickkopf WNT signaling pathway inhibitor 1 n=1 Tax=Vombatus ursinus TaxID=29139 RepID=A0A4X2JS92_VOMUR
MPALAPALAAGAARVLLALAAALCWPPCAPAAATLNTVLVNSNAIKNGHSGPGGGGGGGGGGSSVALVPFWAVSVAPGDSVLFDRPNGYMHVDNKHQVGTALGTRESHHALPIFSLQQHFMCVDDKDCGLEEYCDIGSRGLSSPGGGGGGGSIGVQICLPCRKRRRRCQRTVMCCPGNYCSNGICVPLDQNHLHAVEMDEMTTEPVNNDHSLLEGQPRRTTPSAKTKGQEGAVCLRSSDCADGLCCARHFWSKICKPVLKEGQVCTKHRRKGSHGLEIFQRCFCADGLSCRVQKDHLTNNASRLHTCQKH